MEGWCYFWTGLFSLTLVDAQFNGSSTNGSVWDLLVIYWSCTMRHRPLSVSIHDLLPDLVTVPDAARS
jgi:hypothetical protein